MVSGRATPATPSLPSPGADPRDATLAPSSAAGAQPRPGRSWLAWILPVLVALAIGAAQGRAEPLADDWEVIVNLDRLGLRRALLEDVDASNMRFRAVGYGLLWVERALLGLSFDAVRWIGLAWIGLAGALVGALTRRLGADAGRALGAAVLFVCLPIHTEAYGWACTRVDVVATALGLAALWSAHARRPAAALLLFACAFLTKESAYPLAVAGWLTLRGRSRRDVASAAAGTVALALVLGLKLWIAGGLVASEWAEVLPWSVRLRGYLSQVVAPLHPASSAVPAARALGWAFAAAAGAAVLASTRGSISGGRRRLATVAALGAVVLGCLAVTGGLPARADWNGSRHWFLPAAFAVVALALWVRTPWLALLACVGAPLLHANLAPYREASRRMGVLLDRLAVEVPARERAVRVADLQRTHGPVALFELAPTFYQLRFDTGAPEDRPLLSLAFPEGAADHARIAAVDARWRAWMEAHGRRVLDLTWNAESGTLAESR